MATVTLTARYLDQLKSHGKRYEVFDALVPGLAIGLVLSGLARVFIYVAPRLIGAAAFLGTLATVFAALAWLGLSFQAILFGAAWVRERATSVTPSGARSLEP